MKLALSAFVVAVSALAPPVSLPAGEPTNTIEIAESPVSARWRAEMPDAKEPAVLIVKAEDPAPKSPGVRHVRFLAINPAESAVGYRGYAVDRPADPLPAGRIDPFYQVETEDEKGAWVPYFGPFCATGTLMLEVPAGKAGEFTATVPTDKRVRVGILFTSIDPPESNPRTVWSTPIEPLNDSSSQEAPSETKQP